MMLNISAQLTNWKVPAGEVGEFFLTSIFCENFFLQIFFVRFFFGERCKMYCPGENSFSIRCRRNTSERMMKISRNIPCQDLGSRLPRRPIGLALLELEGAAKAMKTWIGICGSEAMTMTMA